MKRPIPQTPAEQQQLLDDARLALDAGADPRAVLGEVFSALRAAAPAVWARILACAGCHASHEGCDRCRADRLEYAALIGM